ncbi:MAG: hypothetical protein AN484_27565, partial [Aphanizomenon flos-aquae WA102]
KPSLTKRMRFIQEIQNEFWDKWIKAVMQERILATKWRKSTRDSKVGDVVLLLEETMASRHYRMGILSETKTGTDGHVRTVTVRYKNPGENTFRTTVRSVHKVVTLVPVDLESEEGDFLVASDVHPVATTPGPVEMTERAEQHPAVIRGPVEISAPDPVDEILDLKDRQSAAKKAQKKIVRITVPEEAEEITDIVKHVKKKY